jgi:hypothetical protein
MKLAQKLRDDLCVNLYGIRFNKSTCAVIERFFKRYASDLKIKNFDIILRANKTWDKYV